MKKHRLAECLIFRSDDEIFELLCTENKGHRQISQIFSELNTQEWCIITQ